jgi:two-component system CheB/CheR fusion protein
MPAPGNRGRKNSTVQSPAAQRRALRAVAKIPTLLSVAPAFPVVCICAVKDTVDAVAELFTALPERTGMAFVLILPDNLQHDSTNVDMLPLGTTIPILCAADGMVLLPDHVYVLPPHCVATLRGLTLRLVAVHPCQSETPQPFDTFLSALAQDCRERAIVVCLDETNGRTSAGLRAISENGGLVIRREDADVHPSPQTYPDTAADIILPLATIPEALLEFDSWRPCLARHATMAGSKNTRALAAIVDLLAEQTSRSFSSYKDETLLRRAQRQMAAMGVASLKDYAKLLRKAPAYVDALAKDLVVHVTGFFRDRKAFEFLAKIVVPLLVRRATPEEPIRIWIAGCSTGEEAYSVAILFLEEIAKVKRDIVLQIFASDIDKDSVVQARAGRYPEAVREQVSTTRLRRFFIKEEGGYRVAPQVRHSITFSVHDLLDGPPFSRLDLLCCRNVLIYLRPEMQEKILSLFHCALKEHGILFLGPSETIGSMSDRFRPLWQTHRIYERIGSLRPHAFFPFHGAGKRNPIMWPQIAQKIETTSAARGNAGRIAFRPHAPASVLINRHHEPIFWYGPIHRYLNFSESEISADLLSLVREGLSETLSIALRRAAQHDTPAVIEGATITDEGAKRSVSIAARPVKAYGEDLFLVSFIEDHRPTEISDAANEAEPAKQIAALEEELASTRRELEATICELAIVNEELLSANEEAMSVNEEFQSANEELETSKGELQSLNQELTISNQRLQDALEQQHASADDLQNIVNSSAVAMLFLDEELNIRYFTFGAKPLFGVIASDIGRPIADLACRFSDDNLLADARQVLASLTPVSREIKTEDLVWYIRRIQPYRTKDDHVEGVVITFANITEVKAAEQELVAARSYSESVINTVREPLVVLGADMEMISANQSFHRFFGTNPEDIAGRRLGDTAAHPLAQPALKQILDQVRNQHQDVEDRTIEVELAQKGRLTLAVTAREIVDQSSESPKILLAIDNITERERIAHALTVAKCNAERANQTKSQFLAAASHDLRQPLQTLRLLRTILERKLTDQEDLRLIARCGDAIDAMANMLNAILDINKLEAGAIEPTPQDFAINSLLEHLSTEFSVLVESKKLEWHMVPCGETVRSDPRLLNQIMRNLVSNAVNFTSHGKILVGCRRRENKLRIEVWDTGCGIPEADLEPMFGEFRRGQSAGHGLGLGLAIVSRLAALLGHEINVVSTVGKGSCFSVSVPLITYPLRDHTPYATPGTGHILVVEDEPSVRELLDILFAREGHSSASAASGREAIDLVKSGAFCPDIIVVDYGLIGGMTGLDVIESVCSELRQSIPAIVLTGDVSAPLVEKIEASGHYRLTKPVQPEELLEAIQTLLDARPARRPLVTPAVPQAPAAPAPAQKYGLDVPVVVVDDDAGVRETMRELLESEGYGVETYGSGAAFLDAWDPGRRGCVLLDARMPGMDGFEVLAKLEERSIKPTIVMITGFGDIKMAVRALHAGALDFIEKPVDPAELRRSMERAISHATSTDEYTSWRSGAAKSLEALTRRQRAVLDLVITGHANKVIASRLGISQRTVETHRAAAMKKLGARSFADLVRLVLAAT